MLATDMCGQDVNCERGARLLCAKVRSKSGDRGLASFNLQDHVFPEISILNVRRTAQGTIALGVKKSILDLLMRLYP